MKKPKIENRVLQTWENLNAIIMAESSESILQNLLDEELAGRKRKQFVLRIHSRINKIRAGREREALKAQIKS